MDDVHLVVQFFIGQTQFETVAKVEMEPVALLAQSQLGHERLQFGSTVSVNAAARLEFLLFVGQRKWKIGV